MKIACFPAFASSRVALLFTLLTSASGAQNQTWIRQLGTVDDDRAYAAAPDGASGVYVSGFTFGSLGGPSAGASDVMLAHHDSAGNQTWIRQFGTNEPESALAAAPDGAGGVYVSGWTRGSLGGPTAGGDDVWLARYDGTGSQTWIRQFGTDRRDWLSAAAPDGAGGVYVSGNTRGSLGGPNGGGNNSDAWLARYDGNGNQTWVRQFGTTSTDEAYAAAPDGAGGVFVSGITAGNLGGPSAGGADAFLAHYDGAGNQTWMRQFGTDGPEWVVAAAPDGAGGVYVSGRTPESLGGPSAGGDDVWIARYDGAGNQTWILQFGTSDFDSVSAAAPDGAGGVYVSGYTRGSLGGPNVGRRDAWLARFDRAGNQSGVRQFGTAERDEVLAATPDGVGGLYVSGSTEGSLGGPHAGVRNDVWLARHDNFFTTRYCTPAFPNSTGESSELTVTGSNAVGANNFTLAASSLPPQAFGFFLTSMTQLVTATPGGSQGDLCLGGSIGRFNGAGTVLNAGTAGTISLSPDLNAWPALSPAVQPGDTWKFQAWYRDANPGTTSNFTDAVSVTFL